MLKAVGYARISKDDTLEGRGVVRQTEDIAAVCDRHGWELLDVLTDNDVSASRYSKKPRPGYARLLEMIRTGGVDRAVAYNLDRVLRQPRQLEDLIDLCEERNGAFELHAVTGEVDLRTSSGRFTARTLIGVAAMESDNLSRRLKRAYDQRATDGLPHGPRAFGYEPGGMKLRESEADMIRQAAADVLDGASLYAIARRWDESGAKPPQRATSWYAESVKAILIGPRHAGLRTHRGEVIGPAAWPAIIDRETHDRLVAQLTRKRPPRPPRRTAFTGLITGANGVPLDRDVVKGRPTYRGHDRPGRPAAQVSVAGEPLEALIVAAMFEAIDAGTLSTAATEQAARRAASPDLASIEDDLRAIAEDFGEGRISRAEWMAARKPLEDRVQAAQAALDAGVDSATAVTVDLRERWDDLNVDQQRDILATVFDRVVIHPATKRGGPQPMVDGIGRIDVSRVEMVWRV